MPSSELSNALNPYVAQSRPRTSTSSSSYEQSYDLVTLPSQSYIPHRSELELAISEPPQQQPLTSPRNASTRQPNPANLQAVQELLRIVTSTRESQEIERKRRIAWEQEQEAKYTQRHAETERALLELRQELDSLRSSVKDNRKSSPATGLLTPQYNLSPPLVVPESQQPASPISPVSHSSMYPMFAQGHYQSSEQNNAQPPLHPSSSDAGTPALSITPSPSPQLDCIPPSRVLQNRSAALSNKKRKAADSSSDCESHSSDSSTSNPGRRIQRTSHHDKRCLTVHHAMRAHILRVMHLENDKHLPDSHVEGVEIGSNDPVRFVWDKTTKQSVHNSRMKAFVISHIKENRRLYKHVPERDFGKKVLEAAFEASFVTLRQKFKAQRDEALALHYKKREDAKAQKARHLTRRKTKLTNRANARMKVEFLQHVIFDGALQLECMSSEESGDDENGVSLLYTRRQSWRSTRLNRFYDILDEEERVGALAVPKRGLGKRERRAGLQKEGFQLPPSRVAPWMISKGWIKVSQAQYPDLQNTLSKLIEEPLGFDWSHFDALGQESEQSGDENLSFADQHPYSGTQHTQGVSLNYTLP